jgi:formylglycine-generating enzyme required for sulfatase activity
LSASLVFKARADENAARADAKAADLLAANTTIESKRAELEQKNAALDAATQTARANEREATQKTNDVLSLSAIQDLKDLEARADALWPADPENVPKYAAWLADARVLIEGRPGDPAHGIKAKASLAQHAAKLAEIRLLAKPLTAEQIATARRASPSYGAWEKALAELHWMRRMLGDEPWPVEAEVAAALAQEKLPADANGLNNLAWPLIDTDPTKVVYGSEVKGLVLARRAVAAAKESERALFRDTLGWALVRTGRFDEARAEEQRVVQEIQPARKAEYASYLAELEQVIAAWSGETSRARRRGEMSQLAIRVAALERDPDAARQYEFEDGEARWWEAQLSKLVADLRSFTDEKSGGLYSSGVSEKHGWGIVKRAQFAASVDARTLSGAEAKRRWDEAIAAIIASPEYGGRVMTPQLGLLPIGADPDSGLWEFWHVQSGAEPQRGVDEKLILTEEMGIVLVLIPGGTFTLGAQAEDPAKPNYDRAAEANETPYAVQLDAYFLSKYEMTQAQWERFLGRNPSHFGPRNYTPRWNRKGDAWNGLHPVEQMSWNDCARVLARLGLELPTEAQWEHGCRGSTSSVYWSGTEPSTLVDAGNIADQFAKANGGDTWKIHEMWDDGALAPTEVGSYRANDLGLHDTHGNVFEWCRDGYETTTEWRAGSGERVGPGTSFRVYRGGAFSIAAPYARSAYRGFDTRESKNNALGLRPARAARLPASPLHSPGK